MPTRPPEIERRSASGYSEDDYGQGNLPDEGTQIRADLPEHEDYRSLLERLANDDEPLGLPGLVLSSFVRFMTNRRIFAEPTNSDQTWEAVDALLTAPAAMRLRAGERHWALFRQLADDITARGNDVADAYLAAYALENNATWLSADRGFARFNRLRWSHPLDL